MTSPTTERVRIDPADLEPRDRYHLLISAVVPRPIGWISTVSPNGVFNVAPHSYFNVFAADPPIVGFSSSGRRASGAKDTIRNIRGSWDFVANIVTEDIVEAMNVTSADFPPEESEFTWAGLTPSPSERVQAPRVAEAAISLECRVVHILELGRAPTHLVLGEVVLFHVDPTLLKQGRVDPALLKPIGRLGGDGYSRTAAALFEIPRPTWAEYRERQPPVR